jgi:hypothetical protein
VAITNTSIMVTESDKDKAKDFGKDKAKDRDAVKK